MLIGRTRRSNVFQVIMRRKVVFVCAASLLAYVLCNPRPYSVSYGGVIHGVNPSAVGEYLADFNNMKELNPTIEHFTITYDKGETHNYWEYGVYYTEHLSNLPFIKNAAHAVYKIYRLEKPSVEYIIESEHRTCFVGHYFCVDSTSKFICKQHGARFRDSYCKEEVTYECPRLGSWFCFSEVMYQRKAIFDNLARKLATT